MRCRPGFPMLLRLQCPRCCLPSAPQSVLPGMSAPTRKGRSSHPQEAVLLDPARQRYRHSSGVCREFGKLPAPWRKLVHQRYENPWPWAISTRLQFGNQTLQLHHASASGGRTCPAWSAARQYIARHDPPIKIAKGSGVAGTGRDRERPWLLLGSRGLVDTGEASIWVMLPEVCRLSSLSRSCRCGIGGCRQVWPGLQGRRRSRLGSRGY